MQLEGSTAIVTGAGSGLGRAAAEMLHAGGANVVLLDVAPDRVKQVAAELGDRAFAMATDVRDASQVETAITAAVEHFGSLQIAVNCAGVSSAMRTVSKETAHDFELWQRVIDINLTGTFNVLRLAAAQMVRNAPDKDAGERGVIINTASVTAFDGQRGQAAYAASKAGVAGLTLPVARDLSDYAIRCVAIAPGLFETGMMESLSDKAVDALSQGLLFPNRLGDPREFAGLVRHIVENSYLNGTCVRLDGGIRLAGPRPASR